MAPNKSIFAVLGASTAIAILVLNIAGAIASVPSPDASKEEAARGSGRDELPDSSQPKAICLDVDRLRCNLAKKDDGFDPGDIGGPGDTQGSGTR